MTGNKKINIILPFVATKPIGGVKIMYQYANELAEKGYAITLYHVVKKFERKSFLPAYIKLLIFKLRGVERPTWFNLHGSIESKIITDVNNASIGDASIVFSTWWGMAYKVSKLSSSKGKKFNLIQGYEIWQGNKDLVHKSYKLEVNHIVIAKYLIGLVETFSGKKPLYLPNAIDFDKFHIRIAPEQRKPATICMLYSDESIKGSVYGLEALMDLKKIVPEMTAELFSIFKNPGNLPDWINFHHKPEDLAGIYNRNSIFLSPSLTEGWALPPAEAMASGCAVVCTDIGGHQDYAMHEKTALLVKSKDSADLTSKLLRLLRDDDLRVDLAKGGNTYLRNNFNLKHSVLMLEEYFETCQ